MQDKPLVTVIGGGTGTSATISALKTLPVDISAIITVADSGGSTGRLRDEFGFLPVGDLRQALAALAQADHQSWIRDLLLYRFSKGSGLEGHNLGNLILTSLQDMTGSTAKSLEIASKIFRLHGHIYPITTSSVQLVIEYQDGTILLGEHHLDDPKLGGKKIISLKTSPRASIYQESKKTILKSDYVIIGPGDLYGSILPNFVISGAKEACKKTKAKFIYISNLMTRYTQTHNFTAKNHLEVVEKHVGRKMDYVIINNQNPPPKIIKYYQTQHEYPVIDDLDHSAHIIRTPLYQTKSLKKSPGDKLVRSYLRHDSAKLSQVLATIIK